MSFPSIMDIKHGSSTFHIFESGFKYPLAIALLVKVMKFLLIYILEELFVLSSKILITYSAN